MLRRNFIFYFFCFLFIACNNNKNPYTNNLGIEPSVIAQMDTAHYTRIHWQDSLDNFGTIKAGDSVHLKYKFTNIGETPLFILNTRVTCGCTVTNFPKNPVMPGKSGNISVTYKTGAETGEISKTIVVISNTKNKSSHLIIRGVVQPAVNKNQ